MSEGALAARVFSCDFEPIGRMELDHQDIALLKGLRTLIENRAFEIAKMKYPENEGLALGLEYFDGTSVSVRVCTSRGRSFYDHDDLVWMDIPVSWIFEDLERVRQWLKQEEERELFQRAEKDRQQRVQWEAQAERDTQEDLNRLRKKYEP